MATTSLDYLVPDLRQHLGDLNSDRYLDDWLLSALVVSVKALGRWWNYKYLITETHDVYRNPHISFLFQEPPIIENQDERIIILYASIIIKRGSLENNSWSVGSWRDAEISVSNIEGNKAKEFSYGKDWEELLSLITPPNKRLARAVKGSLPGFKGNKFETKTDY